MKSHLPRPFTIVCRPSALAVIQAERAKNRILQHFPDLEIRIITKESAGDRNTSTPLYTLPGRDFFTKDIDEYLLSGEADFAVHSLKDLSLERTEDNRFVSAVFERDDPRDAALFSPEALQKLARNETITLGTSSLRRMELVPPFLEKALPQSGTSQSGTSQDSTSQDSTSGSRTKPRVQCLPMRGNVDSRLRQVREGKFDGAVLAAAGINRLLHSDAHGTRIHTLLEGFRFMLLPLVECPPAPGQGALIIEALRENTDAVRFVEFLRSQHLEEALSNERELLRTFGGGCHQRFGAVSLNAGGENILIANGKDEHGESVEMMRFSVPNVLREKRMFAASDFMRDFFTTEYAEIPNNDSFHLSSDAVFVSHHRAAYREPVLHELRRKRVWTAGTRTWFELAKRGVWVEGCSDGFGLKFLENVVPMPLVGLPLASFHILTNTESAHDWQAEGFAATGLYTLHEAVSAEIQTALGNAEAYFWTSFGQYRACRAWVREGALHLCPSGRTAERFRAEGIEPVIFPSIRAFLLWQRENFRKNNLKTDTH